MPVNPSEARFFECMAQEQAAFTPVPGESMLQMARRFVRVFDKYVEPAAPIAFQDHSLIAAKGHTIRLRYYANDTKTRPLIVFFPGNAFIHDLFEVNHSIISKIALQAGCHAVMVDYRLAPENPYPAALEDAMEAVQHVFQHLDVFRGDRNRVILAGYSSGANLAAVVTNTLRHHDAYKVFHQYLISGGFDYTNSLHEYDAYVLEDKMLDPVAAQFSFDCYARPEQRMEPQCSPYWEKDLSGLPPTVIMVTEFDGGRSQSEGYAKRLIAAGNQVDVVVLPGQTHGTIMYRVLCTDGEDPAIVAGKRIMAVIA